MPLNILIHGPVIYRLTNDGHGKTGIEILIPDAYPHDYVAAAFDSVHKTWSSEQDLEELAPKDLNLTQLSDGGAIGQHFDNANIPHLQKAAQRTAAAPHVKLVAPRPQQVYPLMQVSCEGGRFADVKSTALQFKTNKDGYQLNPDIVWLQYPSPAMPVSILGLAWSEGVNIHVFGELRYKLISDAMDLHMANLSTGMNALYSNLKISFYDTATWSEDAGNAGAFDASELESLITHESEGGFKSATMLNTVLAKRRLKRVRKTRGVQVGLRSQPPDSGCGCSGYDDTNG